MQIGIVGVGTVGGSLYKWLSENTKHKLIRFDPYKGLNEDLEGCDAIFICVPVPAKMDEPFGQDQTALKSSVELAKKHCSNVFIRSTVTPGTNDELGTISAPEFLTERRASDDMKKLPVVVGRCDKNLIQTIFQNKEIIMVSNYEAEAGKIFHNCFGAMKVTFFNLVKSFADENNADFERIKQIMFTTGFIENEHTMVPGPDGFAGYGGKCFPENITAMKSFLFRCRKLKEYSLFNSIDELNQQYRIVEDLK